VFLTNFTVDFIILFPGLQRAGDEGIRQKGAEGILLGPWDASRSIREDWGQL